MSEYEDLREPIAGSASFDDLRRSLTTSPHICGRMIFPGIKCQRGPSHDGGCYSDMKPAEFILCGKRFGMLSDPPNVCTLEYDHFGSCVEVAVRSPRPAERCDQFVFVPWRGMEMEFRCSLERGHSGSCVRRSEGTPPRPEMTTMMGIDRRTVRGVLSNLISLRDERTDLTIMDTLRRLIDKATASPPDPYDGESADNVQAVITALREARRLESDLSIVHTLSRLTRGDSALRRLFDGSPEDLTPRCPAESDGRPCTLHQGHTIPHSFA